MANHTASYNHDPDMAIPGHHSGLVYVHQTRVTGLHCGNDHYDGCGWYGGSFKGRWSEQQMAKAWKRHVEFVEAGGKLTHGLAANVAAGNCHCVNCSIPYRMQQNGAEAYEVAAIEAKLARPEVDAAPALTNPAHRSKENPRWDQAALEFSPTATTAAKTSASTGMPRNPPGTTKTKAGPTRR